MAGRFLLGTQGWNHPGWSGSFYPHNAKISDFLDVYTRAFPTVEIDSTFYAIPAEPVVAGWRERAPAGFTFALKVPQEITHERRLVDVEPRLTRFLKRVSLLEDRLGPLLAQLSPDFRVTDATRAILRDFVNSLPSGFQWAIEFRQPHWLTPDVLDLLRSRNVALVLTEGRWIKRAVVLDQALEPTANFGYARWTAPARKAHPAALAVDRHRELSTWAAALKPLAEQVDVVYGYFSNQFQGHAPGSARQMQRLLGIDPVEPSMLREQAELF